MSAASAAWATCSAPCSAMARGQAAARAGRSAARSVETSARDPISNSRPRRKSAHRARGHRAVPDLPRLWRRAGRDLQDVPRVQRTRRRIARPGRLRGARVRVRSALAAGRCRPSAARRATGSAKFAAEEILITVPAGRGHRQQGSARGQGGRAPTAGRRATSVITFQVQPDRFFRRDGLDVIATVPLNIAQATLGSRISVRTLDGKKVAIRIPPGTPAGNASACRVRASRRMGSGAI